MKEREEVVKKGSKIKAFMYNNAGVIAGSVFAGMACLCAAAYGYAKGTTTGMELGVREGFQRGCDCLLRRMGEFKGGEIINEYMDWAIEKGYYYTE